MARKYTRMKQTICATVHTVHTATLFWLNGNFLHGPSGFHQDLTDILIDSACMRPEDSG